MPRSPKDNLEIRETRRDEILEAATRVFADKGFAGAKIAEIAAEAGLSHGLVYHYFKSKDALLLSIVEQMTDELDADMERAEPRAVDRVRAVVARRCKALQKPGNSFQFVVKAALQGSLPEDARANLQAHFERSAARQREWIAEAQADGDLDDAIPPDEIMKVVISAMRGMCVHDHKKSLALPSVESVLQLLLPPKKRAPRKRVTTRAPRKRVTTKIRGPAKEPRSRS